MPFTRTASFVLATMLASFGGATAHGREQPAQQPAPAKPIDIGDDPRVAVVSAKPTLAFIGGRWFDGAAFGRATWYSVDGRLTAKRPARVDVTVDLKNRWIVLPLAEAHNHNMQDHGSAARYAPDYVRRGIFYMAQLFANTAEAAPFRDFLNGPGTVDALFAEVSISASDGHPIALAVGLAKQAGQQITPDDLRDRAFTVIDTAADLDRKWAKIAEAKPRLVKVILIDGANWEARRADPRTFGANGIDPRLLPPIVERAHAIGARVAVHVQTADDFGTAVRAGADIMAHLPGNSIGRGRTIADYRLNDAMVAEAARRGVIVIPTVAVAKYYLQAKPGDADAINANYRDNLTRLKDAGVPILTGSDLYDGSVLDEIEALERTGVFTRAELLRMSGTDTARALFPGRAIGRFAEGAEASLVALGTDPLSDLAALRQPALLVKQGEILAR